MTGKRRWLPFIVGILTGTVLTTLLCLIAIYIGAQQVWLVRVNTNGVTERMEGAATVLVDETLPTYIEDLKPTIPDLVAESVNGQFDDIKFQLGGEEFSLPQELVERLENNYRTNLIDSIYQLLDSLALEEMGDELGGEIAAMVQNSIFAEFNSQQIDLELIEGRFSVPVIVEFADLPGHRGVYLQLYSATQPGE